MNNLAKASALSSSLSKAEANLLGLMHSALDIDDTRLHEFSQWISSGDFVNAPRQNRDALNLAKLQVDHPIKYHNFSSEPENNYSGFGLKSVLSIGKNEQIVKMSADMGLVSNVFVEGNENEKEGEDQQMQD